MSAKLPARLAVQAPMPGLAPRWLLVADHAVIADCGLSAAHLPAREIAERLAAAWNAVEGVPTETLAHWSDFAATLRNAGPRRMMACLRACKGIDTEALERLSPGELPAQAPPSNVLPRPATSLREKAAVHALGGLISIDVNNDYSASIARNARLAAAYADALLGELARPTLAVAAEEEGEATEDAGLLTGYLVLARCPTDDIAVSAHRTQADAVGRADNLTLSQVQGVARRGYRLDVSSLITVAVVRLGEPCAEVVYTREMEEET